MRPRGLAALLAALAVASLCLSGVSSAAGAALARPAPARPAPARPAPARPAPARPANTSLGVALPIFGIGKLSETPPGFATTANDAIAAAKSSPRMQAIHRREHPLQIYPKLWLGAQAHWWIEFYYRNRLAAEVDVSPQGRVTGVWTGPLAVAVYARGDYAPKFNRWWLLVAFSVLFALPFLDPRRLLRVASLDALAVLSFLVSFELFEHGHLETAVWLVYVPLLYLLVRMGTIGLRGRRRRPGLAPWLSRDLLAAGLLALMGARIALSLANREVIDVGLASVTGASRLVHGHSLYYASTAHGDTYGPFAYLAYVPFVLAFPFRGSWDYLPSAHAAAIAFDLVTVLALVALGRRLRSGPDGTRLGLALGWAWAACPFTLLGLMMHTNDGLIAMLAALALLVFSSPAGRGATIALAAAAKFTPAALLPLFAGGRDRSPRRAAACVVAFAVAAAVLTLPFIPSGGLRELYDHTIGYQLGRSDVFSAWALHPGLKPLKIALEVAVALACVALAVVPRHRSLTRVAALAAAATIAVQLPAVHWFYYYLVWFLPFALVPMLHAEDMETAAIATT